LILGLYCVRRMRSTILLYGDPLCLPSRLHADDGTARFIETLSIRTLPCKGYRVPL